MTKINKIANVVSSEVQNVLKKVDDIPTKPLKDYSKYVDAHKILADSAAAQGKAMVDLKVNSAVTNGLATARKVAKKAPLSNDKKTEVLGKINAKIEDRHLTSTLSKKSAEKSADVILEQSPVDILAQQEKLAAKKEELMEKFGDKLQEKHAKEASIKQEKITQAAVRNVRRLYLDDARDYERRVNDLLLGKTFIQGHTKFKNDSAFCEFLQQQDGIRANSKNMAEYEQKLWESLRKVFTDDGLVQAKEEMGSFVKKYPDDKMATKFLEAINSELEFRNVTGALGKADSFEEIKEALLDEKMYGEYHFADKLSNRKQELMDKFGEQLETQNRAKVSAKTILEQSPVDLGARKMELQEKYDIQAIKNTMQQHNVGQSEAISMLEKQAKSIEQQYNFDSETARKIALECARNPLTPMYYVMKKYAN